MSGENTQATPEENNEEIVEEAVAPTEGENTAEEPTLEADVQGFANDAAQAYQNADGADLQAQLEEMKNKWMRSVAEEQNVRRRAEREKQDALKYGVTNFAREMVSVADNLRRALASATEEQKDTDLVKGVEMTERELQSAFKKAGIQRVEAEGQPFDHNVHQAMYEIEDPSQPAGIVAQVMQDGYVIHDRLLRPAMVGVTKGGPKYEAPVEGEAAAEEAQPEVGPEGPMGGEQGTVLDQET